MKKHTKAVAIVLTILLVILNIFIYLKLNNNWSNLTSSNNSYESAGWLISSAFIFGTLLYGIALIPILWLEYLLIYLIKKVYTKYNGIKKTIYLSLLSLVAIFLLFIFIRILLLLLYIIF